MPLDSEVVPTTDATPAASAIPELSRAAALNSVGAKLFGEGQLEPARLHFLGALQLEPDNYLVAQNLGAVLRTMGHYEAAATVARLSVKLSKGNVFCKSNLGVSELNLRRYAKALLLLKEVVEELPNSGPSWHNYGLALYMAGDFADALSAFDRALACGHRAPQVLSDRALALLALGRLQEGLAAYEVRWELLKKNRVWGLGLPEWQGEPLVGVRLLVHHEQGFGDSIMLSRFVPMLVQQGATVTLAVPDELVRLFTASFGISVRVVSLDDEVLNDTTAFDFHSPLLSVMRWLGVDSPRSIKARTYLRADPVDVALIRMPKRKTRVGICWASGNHGAALQERRRVVPLPLFLPLLELPNTAVVSLQKGAEVRDIQHNGMEGLLFDLSPQLLDFGATAAAISQLDLVISVDSAVAHLASALGKQCVMLGPFSRCWRWWGASRGRAAGIGWPWYENMSVFTQTSSGSWDYAVRRAIYQVARWKAVK